MGDTVSAMKQLSAGIEDPALKQSVRKIKQDRGLKAQKSLCRTCTKYKCQYLDDDAAERGVEVLRCSYYANS